MDYECPHCTDRGSEDSESSVSDTESYASLDKGRSSEGSGSSVSDTGSVASVDEGQRTGEKRKPLLSKPYYTLQVKDPQIAGCAICPANENLLLFNGSHNLFLYNVNTRTVELVKRLNYFITDMAFSHDGSFFSVLCGREALFIYKTSCRKLKWQCDSLEITEVIWHPTENLLFMLIEGLGLCVTLIPDFTCSFLLDIQRYFFWISTAGNKILSYVKKTKVLRLWDVAEMKLNFIIKRNKISHLENSERVFICNLNSGNRSMVNYGKKEQLMKLQHALNSFPSFSAGRSVQSFECDYYATLIAGEDKNRIMVTASPYVKVHALDDGKLLAEVRVAAQDQRVENLSVKDDFLAASTRDNISIVSLISFDIQYVVDAAYSIALQNMYWIDSDILLLVYNNGFVKLFDLIKKEETKSYHCHRNHISHFGLFSDKKKFLTIASDRTIKVFTI